MTARKPPLRDAKDVSRPIAAPGGAVFETPHLRGSYFPEIDDAPATAVALSTGAGQLRLICEYGGEFASEPSLEIAAQLTPDQADELAERLHSEAERLRDRADTDE